MVKANNYSVVFKFNITFDGFSAREATVQKIESIIREQFSLEMNNKEHEIDVISQVSEQFYNLSLILLLWNRTCTLNLNTMRWFSLLFIVWQRLNEARRMMDKLRACIVANYYASAGIPKLPEVHSCMF